MGDEVLKPLVILNEGAETEEETPEEEAPLSEVKSQRASVLKSLREDGRKSLTQMKAYRKEDHN